MCEDISVGSSASRGLQLALNFSPSNSSTQCILAACFTFPTVTHIVTAFCTTNTLLFVPLYVIILYLGFQQQKRCCLLFTSTTSRHSDLLTYNMVAMGLIEVLAANLYPVGAYTTVSELSEFGFLMYTICWFEKLNFHTLTCIECYVAVVHPVMYLGLKKETGSRVRTIIIGSIWLQLLVWPVSVLLFSEKVKMILFLCHLVFAFTVVFFCGVSVLWALKRPSPGEVSRDRERVHQTKRRAFFTILTIMCAVLSTLVWVLLCNLFFASLLLNFKNKCLLLAFVPWFCLPCTALLPLLYLHRTRKQLRCSQKSK